MQPADADDWDDAEAESDDDGVNWLKATGRPPKQRKVSVQRDAGAASELDAYFCKIEEAVGLHAFDQAHTEW